MFKESQPRFQPRSDRLFGRFAQKSQALALSFATNGDDAAIEVKVGEVQAAQFRFAQTRRIKSLQNGNIARGQRAVASGAVHEPLGFVLAQKVGELLLLARPADSVRGVGSQRSLTAEEAEPRADSG